MKVMVVGGAGYIGAHVVRLLETRGDEIVVVDDLSYGSPERIGGAELVKLDCADASRYPQLLAAMRGVDAVIHFAARKQVGESVQKPAWYYQQNIGGLALVLQAMGEAGVGKMIFSSSAAVYGMPDTEIVPEDIEKRPINPYGETKLFGETMMAACQRAFGLRWIGLRYFNVAGAGASDLGDPAILNLIPMVFERIVAGENPLIFGDDYPTPDGTCVRDYVHVQDLAQAHLEALDYMSRAEAAGQDLEYHVFNVGTSTGYSVKEVVDVVAKVMGIDFTPEVCARRAGDPPRLIADSTRIRQIMGFEPRYDLEQIVRSAWEAWQVKPGRH
ncbi:UDP-glucose 4-epimerase GalE [Mobiluncus mulieris]|uniref:UDP-glucose 4-epimerase n=1 Tax=Mobiluncus mulieris TaxID=2052 RepID=A0ABD4TVF1_9ACTO|nr:UDP-glucose 4-epimerase GalE [Mobiluncus mulieris]MCU9968874.1 UDP-glucose 4-epimerase GalE [Mobiluncus mulieris]MCV0008621.1 UDP-glucose 4-epimerase GalE [Mobiluncus mulieris]MCV0013502.1 UDP-glucose 4-epimerase GalE [Mobiluncus mulieris]NMW74296.1 UDP-glucose 4-epimerase GalE [Mobiluncus mulieris]NMX00792.1 UDP-glucose 4-epimerase GalE [Mobiluncus mulieris]